MAKLLRRLLCAVAMVIMIVSLCTVCFAESAQEIVCYEHGDVDSNNHITNTDAIYVMSHYMFDDEEDDVEDIFKFKGTIHSYYAPTWEWDKTANTAEVTIRCGCGNVIATYTTGNA